MQYVLQVYTLKGNSKKKSNQSISQDILTLILGQASKMPDPTLPIMQPGSSFCMLPSKEHCILRRNTIKEFTLKSSRRPAVICFVVSKQKLDNVDDQIMISFTSSGLFSVN